ncbi:17477_t:CDS:2, partial [Gigaspora rosea]
LALDDLISHTFKALAKKCNFAKRAQACLKKRIQNLIYEVHKKSALLLTFNSTQCLEKTDIQNCKIVITSVLEVYTSKTCSHCGYIKDYLGGNKEFRCNKCGLQINRDLNST